MFKRCMMLPFTLFALVGCVSAPARTSPALEPAEEIVPWVLATDRQAENAVWVESVEPTGGEPIHNVVANRDGVIVAIPPELDEEPQLRVHPDGSVWICDRYGIGRWRGGAWEIFSSMEIFGEGSEGSVACDWLTFASRNRDDFWLETTANTDVASFPSLCHFDGEGWACRPRNDGESLLAVTSNSVYWVEGGQVVTVPVEGFVDAESQAIGPLPCQESMLTPVPGADQILVQALDVFGCVAPSQVMGAGVEARAFERAGDVFAAGPEDFLQLTSAVDLRESNGTYDPLGGLYNWSQLVVYRGQPGSMLEVGHRSYESSGDGAFGKIFSDRGDFYVRDADYEWWRIPSL